MTSITLTEDQQSAMEKFFYFLADEDEGTFVLEGSAGCGKSTLVGHILNKIPNFIRAQQLIYPDFPSYEMDLTATTN